MWTEGRPPFADVSLTLWRELAMLTAPTAGQLENVPIAVPLQDYAVGSVAVQVQEQLQWNGANNMMEKVQQGAAGRAAGLGGKYRAHRRQYRRLQKNRTYSLVLLVESGMVFCGPTRSARDARR